MKLLHFDFFDHVRTISFRIIDINYCYYYDFSQLIIGRNFYI